MICPLETMPYNNFNQALQTLEQIQAIDFYLAQGIVEALTNTEHFDLANLSAPQLDEFFHLIIALSHAQRDGHSCLDINLVAGQTLYATELEEDEAKVIAQADKKSGVTFSSIAIMRELLNALQLHAQNLDNPVIFEHDKLYLRRYWQFEIELASFIEQKVKQVTIEGEGNNLEANRDILTALFPHREDELDWQLMAVANALNKTFTIIAGGPGTGKTYTVTKLLAGLLMQNRHANIAMVAPTGKAAQRLSESITNAVGQFKQQKGIDQDILAAIPSQASTIHRLLGVVRNSPNFRHDAQKQLSCDVLLIDEVSMVDLPMMTRLFRALPTHCRVILLGDSEQLPSVATGSVLADLAPNKHSQYSIKNQQYLQHTSGQQLEDVNVTQRTSTTSDTLPIDYLTYLTKSRRFDGEGGIGKIARLVIDGQVPASWQLLTANDNKELSYIDGMALSDYVKKLTKHYYQPIFKATSVEQAFQCLNDFRILAPTRQGEYGLDNLNVLIEQTLRSLKCIKTQSQLYRGRAIMISQNHYGVNLFNGDIGILWPSAADHTRLVAVFPCETGYREISISRLPSFETVYAMTIHKTQGSEFKNVALILPAQGANRLLSRELIYTGITRAKKHLQIFCQQSTWASGVSKRVDRASGLTARLLTFLQA